MKVFLNTNTDADPVFNGYQYVQVNGSNYDTGNYSSPYIIDWDEDGKKDVLIGCENGTVALLINTGTNANPSFSSSSWVQDGGSSLDVGSSSSPVATDWNQDGAKDLLVGDATGYIYFFENIGTNAAPVFDGSEKLEVDEVDINVGSYARFDVCDWDEDGLDDIICGYDDYTNPAPAGALFFHRAWFYYPDLNVDNFAAPTEVEPGDNVSALIDLTISNKGEIDATNFNVGVYVSEDDNITTGDDLLVDGEVLISSVQVGQTYDVTFNAGMCIPSDIVMGQYYIGVILDSHRDIDELDEDNNTAALPIKIGDPPVPDIKIDGDDGPLTIPSTQVIDMTISLLPGSLNGITQDWWIVAYKDGGGVFSWVYNTPGHWTSGLWKAHRGPLFALNDYNIRHGTIPAGTWTIEFAVDEPNYFFEKTYMDEIVVTVY